jgi:DNA-binding beta-propeller fold protein YncE
MHTGSRGAPSSTPPDAGPTAYVIASADGNQGFSDTMVRISLATDTVIEPAIRLPAGQAHAEITPDGKIICVLTDTLRRAYIMTINARTGAASRPITLPSGDAYSLSTSFAITPDGHTAYLLNQPVPGGPRSPAAPGGVVPVNLVTGSVGTQIGVPGAQQLVITPNGRTVYVLTQQAASRRGPQYYGPHPVVPINTATNTALTPIKVGAGGLAGSIAVSPDGKIVYVSTFWVNHVSAVTPVSTASNTAMNPIPIRLAAYSGGTLAIAPDGNTAYLYGNSQYLFAIDLRTNEVLKAITLPADYACIMRDNECVATSAWTFQIAPDSRTAYLYGPPGGRVIPIDLGTGTVQAPLPVAAPPYTQVASDLGPLGIAFGPRNLYIGVGFITSPSRDAHLHGALSEVQLTTGKVTTVNVGDWPQEVILTP